MSDAIYSMYNAATEVLSRDRLLEIYKLAIAAGVFWGSYKGFCDWWGSKVVPLKFKNNYVMNMTGPIINNARSFTIFATKIGASGLLTGFTVATLPITGPLALVFGQETVEDEGVTDAGIDE